MAPKTTDDGGKKYNLNGYHWVARNNQVPQDS